MDTLNLTKSELKILLLLSSLVPVLSFIGGVYFAYNPETVKLDVPAQTQVNASIEPLHPGVINESIIEEESVTQTQQDESILADVETVEAEPVAMAKRYIVQAGLFMEIENARNLSDALLHQELDAQIIEDIDSKGLTVFRVVVGTFDTQEQAKTYQNSIEQIHAIKLYLTTTLSNKNLNLIAAL